MKKTYLIAAVGACALSVAPIVAKTQADKQQERLERMKAALQALPNESWDDVSTPIDLLQSQVYEQLAREGWSKDEIISLMNTVMADKKKAKTNPGYLPYSKRWLPKQRVAQELDSAVDPLDPKPLLKMKRAVEAAQPADLINHTWERKFYTPDDRYNGRRDPGYFRQLLAYAADGRVNWAEIHPDDPDKLMILPDGGGIMRTDDFGRHWRCITDNIPDRGARECVNGYSIPVDNTDWNHVFGFMNGGSIWETLDGGETWTRVEGARHYGFKRGRCFRDSQGNLRLIGCQQARGNTGVDGNGGAVYISEDKGVTWTAVQVPDELKDPIGGSAPGLWFQQIEFDPFDRDKIYLPTGKSIMYFDDGARPTRDANGRLVYHIIAVR